MKNHIQSGTETPKSYKKWILGGIIGGLLFGSALAVGLLFAMGVIGGKDEQVQTNVDVRSVDVKTTEHAPDSDNTPREVFDNTPGEAGLYDSEGKMIKTWEELQNEGIVTVANNSLLFTEAKQLSGQLVIKEGVTSIGDCKLVDRGSLRKMGYGFMGCSKLTGITIPSSVMSIDYRVFVDCGSLETIEISEDNSQYDSRDNCNGIIETETNTLIVGCNNTTIPDSVTNIEKYAFQGCRSLTSITIPNHVTSIGKNVFKGCRSLTSTTLPDSVTSIGKSAFEDCSSLTNITIPEHVVRIGESAFLGCKSLTSITLPDSVTSIGEHVFCDCSGLTSITLPGSVTSIGEYAFMGCSSLTGITIPDSVTSIEGYAFCDCSSLTSIVLPDSVTSIGCDAFWDCSSLTSITIPDSVTSIGSEAFMGCRSLTSITLPDRITRIGKDAFYDTSVVYYNGTASGRPWGAGSVEKY